MLLKHGDGSRASVGYGEKRFRFLPNKQRLSQKRSLTFIFETASIHKIIVLDKHIQN